MSNQIIPNTDYLYMIGADSDFGHPVKIGVSCDLEKRLYQLNTGSPVKLAIKATLGPFTRKVAYSLEDTIHSKLSEYHIRGEWFKASCKPAFLIAATHTSYD